MPKQVVPVEVNNFVAGLVTDASPLTFPDNASLDEDNFVLNTDGSRNRRLGMDEEDNAVEITTSMIYSSNNVPAHTSYRWSNAGGNPDKNLLVVQFGNEIKFFDLENTTISSEVIDTHLFSATTLTNMYSYAVVDGLLIVATGEKEVNIFEYDDDLGTISHSTDTLLIRDLFGVEDIVDSKNLKVGNNITIRPTTKTDEHIYNLRNQTFAEPRKPSNGETPLDPIKHFHDRVSKYPSNSDTVTQSLFPDANDTDDRISERFFADDLEANPLGSSPAPSGFFIIDALERGVSRLQAYDDLIDKQPASANMIDITTLPSDTTPGGASVVAQYAGRIWYAGFSGEVTDGDSKSPRMSSYVLFSQQVEDATDIVRCYQDGDPTSKETPDILDTDGGFIRIDEAYGIKSLVNLDNSLFVLAQNGVWRIVGDDRGAFRATGYSIIKISDRGVRGAKSIVEVEGSLVYWGDDGIYNISRNQFGDWVVVSLTENTLQSFYNDISTQSKDLVQGYYDSYDKKVRWIYNNEISSTSNVRELVLDKPLGAFYTNTIFTPSGTNYPKIIGIFETDPFKVSPGQDTVEVGTDIVQVGGVDVIISSSVRTSTTRQIGYVAVTYIDSVIKYKFSLYKNTDFKDWKSVDGNGTDAAGFLVTGYLSGGDFQRQKQITFLTTYLRKTEDRFVLDGNGDFTPTNTSSCLVQVRWDWTNLSNANRWSTEKEFYRHRRLYFPVDLNDEFDDGQLVVASRDKIRGKGRVLSIKFSTSEGKDCHLYGWSLVMGVQSNV